MMVGFRALQKLEAVGEASREALRCEFQGGGGWRPVHHEVLLGQVNYSPSGTCACIHHALYLQLLIIFLVQIKYIFRNDLCGSSEKSAKIDVSSIANMGNHELVQLQRKVIKGKHTACLPIQSLKRCDMYIW